MSIGSKIKQLRTLCGLTQEELGNRCDLTKGYISQLENDLTSPSISTLTDILSALGTDLKNFFNDEDEDEKITFKPDDYFIKETDEYKIEWLVPNSQKNEMEPIMITINPGCATDVDMPHEGQEFGYVLEGKVVVVYGNRQEQCNKGDTFYITTDKNHYLYNKFSKSCKIIWISSPPNF